MHSLAQKNVFGSTLHPTTKLIWNFFKMSYSTEFSADWLTDWSTQPTNWLTHSLTDELMTSDKIMAIRLDFFTNQHCFVLRCAFLPTAAAPALALWLHQSLPLFYFVLHSFLHNCIADNLGYACYDFSARLWLELG